MGGQTVSVNYMREYLDYRYNGIMNGRLVKDMPDRQVMAIYYRLTTKKPTKKKTDGEQITMGELYGIH